MEMTPHGTPEECPFASLRTAVTTHVRNWSGEERDAWMYGIIVGWDDDVLAYLKVEFTWTDEDVDRLRRLQSRFSRASEEDR